MNPIAAIDMDEVIRLTRAGRLLDATALLQAGLGGRRTSAPPDRHDKPRLEVDRSDAGDTARQHPAATTRQSFETASPDRKKKWGLDLKRRFKLPHSAPKPTFPPGSSFETHTVTNAAGALDYKLYIPSRRVAGPVPLVVMLHGCTQSPDDFAVGTRMNELAELHGFLVAYPAQAKSANASRCWNWFKSGDQHRDRGEPSLIADATRQIVSRHTIDAGRVYVAGLSAGGAAAAIMGCAYPDIYAGVGVHSGLACGAASDLPSALQAMRNGGGRRSRPSSSVPTIVFHGKADRTVGPANADEVSGQVITQSSEATMEQGVTVAGMRYIRTVRRDTAGRPASEQWMVEGGGHAWFGGNPNGSYTDPRGPDASREMLRFFGILSETS